MGVRIDRWSAGTVRVDLDVDVLAGGIFGVVAFVFGRDSSSIVSFCVDDNKTATLTQHPAFP